MKTKENSHVGTCEACGRKDVILHDVEMLMCMTAHWCKPCIDECDAQALLDSKCTCETHSCPIHGDCQPRKHKGEQ